MWTFLPVAIMLTVLVFVFYRRMLNDPVLAAVATVTLNLQGDYLFTSSRGTHEKMIYTLVFVALLAMALAIARFGFLRWRVSLALIYYLAMFAINATNVFFGSTFTITLLLAFLIGVSLVRQLFWWPRRQMWLMYVAAASFILTYLVIFVIYPPARSMVVTAHNLSERLRLLFLSSSEPPAIYNSVNQAWILPGIWLVLRIPDLFLVVMAAVGWLLLARHLRNWKSPPAGLTAVGCWWLLIMFPAFSAQNVFALISDITGPAGEINNLQVRLIPLTTFAAAPLSVYALSRLFVWVRSHQQWRRWATAGLVLTIVCFAGIALVKSTSEPLLSNAWMFYSPSEAVGVNWLHDHILLLDHETGRQTPRVWAGPDFRLGRLWLMNYWGPARHLVPVTSAEPYGYVLLSPVVRLHAARMEQPLPDVEPMGRVYDNGQVRIYHRGP
jgi:hypothetical protein